MLLAYVQWITQHLGRPRFRNMRNLWWSQSTVQSSKNFWQHQCDVVSPKAISKKPVYTCLYVVIMLYHYIATSRGLKSDFNFRIIVAPTRKITISPSYRISRERRDSQKQSSATHGVNSAERTVNSWSWETLALIYMRISCHIHECYDMLFTFIHIVPENACQQLLALALTSKITPEMSLQVCAYKKQYVTTGVHVPNIVTKLTLASGLQRAGWFWTAAAKECSFKRLCLFKDSHWDNVLVLSFCRRLSVRAVPVPGLEKKPPLFTKPKEMWNSPNSWKRKLHIHPYPSTHTISSHSHIVIL